MNESLWIGNSKREKYNGLNQDLKVNNLIVGGGIVGLTTAYLLASRGEKVTLVEADSIGYGTTGRSTGKVTTQHNIIYQKIEKVYGFEVSKKYYLANKRAISILEDILTENNIDAHYVKVPSYIFSEDEKNKEVILKEFELCKKIGIDCEFTMELPLPIKITGAIKFNNSGQFNPIEYLEGLVKAITDKGVKIYENTSVKSIQLKGGYQAITDNDYTIKADRIIICTQFPFYDGLSFYFTRLKPERSYIVAGEYTGGDIGGTFINIEEPRRSIRSYKENGRNLILIGGENHKVALQNDKNHYDALKAFGKEVFGLENYNYQWSAQDYITPDYIPYIGYLNTVRDKILVATGFSKWGITNGIVAAMILSDLAMGIENEYSNIFNPSRKDGYYTKEFLNENLKVGIEYIKGKILSATKEMPEIGEGKVVRINKEKYGAYRDDNGKLHIVDITCTHLGCELIFNLLEKSWDCPCHGSRFSIDGEILNGPATAPLNYYGSENFNEINPNLL